MIKWYKQIDKKQIKTLLDDSFELINVINKEIEKCAYMSKKEELNRFLYLLKTYEIKLNEIYVISNK